jgi:hypothetical protein
MGQAAKDNQKMKKNKTKDVSINPWAKITIKAKI